ncbi:NAD-dependent epimerase/dehydratase family protein [Paractinoplanes abujensis]|uniref:Nucleoside-diphosphate-sugar epimerase n=1 Tax=Paractinoplanes abujensis TaxID=882441 RepID=A0A7W7G4G0_9ACTN|nr:NAD(P)-dependent oxidoreductase [Actinoplanes abujensis]MBB4693791.1 nucleoside-diphosphate-sugar epimerase [Actinoplanes abujensis]
MRIFLAGASGVIGRRLVPLLVAAGHTVGGMTRSQAARVASLGAEPIVCDVFDRAAVIEAVRAFAPDLILNELTDLPDDAARIAEHQARNGRIRTEGTGNLIAAARQAGSPRLLSQSIAWPAAPGPGADGVAALERETLAYGGVVLRYGQFYGPGTFHEDAPPGPPQIAIEKAASRTVELLGAPAGVLEITD